MNIPCILIFYFKNALIFNRLGIIIITYESCFPKDTAIEAWMEVRRVLSQQNLFHRWWLDMSLHTRPIPTSRHHEEWVYQLSSPGTFTENEKNSWRPVRLVELCVMAKWHGCIMSWMFEVLCECRRQMLAFLFLLTNAIFKLYLILFLLVINMLLFIYIKLN